MGREFELKYALDEESFHRLSHRFAPFEMISMETVYYDTPSGSLSGRKWMLRRRMENGKAVCTLKTPASGGGRGEWETACAEAKDALEVLIALGAPAELAEIVREGLVTACAARFHRLAKQLTVDGTLVELALDRGELMGATARQPLLELEVELKQGSEATAAAFAAELARQYGLREEKNSKFARARQLD